MEYPEKSVKKLSNVNAKRFLANEYIGGEHIELKIDKDIEMLTECADGGDPTSLLYARQNIFLKAKL